MRYFVLLGLLIIPFIAHAQPVTPKEYGLQEFSFNHKKLGLIRFYVDTNGIQVKAPLFIETNGSGGLPLCLYVEGKKFVTTSITFNSALLEQTKQKYHYVILGKPGTAFCDSVRIAVDVPEFQRDPQIVTRSYPYSTEYTERLSLDWRVEATKAVISYLIKNKFWDRSKIVAYGYSEGGQVVPALAVADKRITHQIPVVGSGLNQFYNDILDWRFKAMSGQLTHRQAQDSINLYLATVRTIYQHPNETKAQFAGHSYKRWASFGSSIAFENLRKVNIPIYLLVATADKNSPIYSLDYIQLDFIRLGKRNLTYEPCVGCNHYLLQTQGGQSVDYNQRILDWVDKN